jgi:hypothetical protein
MIRRLGLGLLILAGTTFPAGSALAGVQLGVVINEIHYGPQSVATGPLKYEYVELYAKVTTPLAGWQLQDLTPGNIDDLLFTFPTLTLPAGAYLVIVSSNAAGVLPEDTDLTDGSGLLIATSLWTADLANSGDAVILSDASQVLQDFVYYDEINVGEPSVDDEAVAEGIWKDGAAIDVLSSSTTGRAIALKEDGESPNELNPVADAEDLDWMQYSAADGGTPGGRNRGTVAVFPNEISSGGFHGVRPSPITSGPASFQFTLASPGLVGFEILDVSGRTVSSVATAAFSPGPGEVTWNPALSLPAGLYVVQMTLGGRPAGARKIVVLR